MAKPPCNSLGKPDDGSEMGIVLELIALAGVVGAFGTAAALAEKLGTETFLGVTGLTALWIAAAAGAVATLIFVGLHWYHSCLKKNETLKECSSGVVNNIVEAWSSSKEGFLPFTAKHDRVDIVVKSMYWDLLIGPFVLFVHCNDDADSSPILRAYYKDPSVCAAGMGATIGAAVAVVPAILAGLAVAALIGCAATLFFGCLLAILVAALVAAAVVLIGAIIGGHIGRGLAEDTSPSSPEKSLVTGDYVMTRGGLMPRGEDEFARVYWFVDETSLLGKSMGQSPFSFKDPDDPNTGISAFDGCRVPPTTSSTPPGSEIK